MPDMRPADELNYGAVKTIPWLGTNAAPAVPYLVDLLRVGGDIQRYVVTALGSVGPAGAPAVLYLRPLATGTNEDMALCAAGALWNIDKDTNAVLTVSERVLDGTNQVLMLDAASLLGNIGAPAARFGPTLIKMLQNTNLPDGMRGNAAIALAESGYTNQQFTNVLLQGLSGTNRARVAFARALWKVDSKYASTALPIFIEYQLEWQKRIHRPPDLLAMTTRCHLNLEDALPTLERLATGGDEQTRQVAQTALTRLQASARHHSN